MWLDVVVSVLHMSVVFCFKQKTAYGMRISGLSSDLFSADLGQRLQQVLRAHHLAGQRIADPDGQRRRRRLALQHDVEVGVEGGDLVDRRHRQLHLARERAQVARGQMPVARSEEHTSELQSLMRISYAVFCLKKKKHTS